MKIVHTIKNSMNQQLGRPVHLLNYLNFSKLHDVMWYLPIALERLRPPLTRPSGVTVPPAFSILSHSGLSSGLWSNDRSIAWPPRDSTHRESPALATTRCLLRSKATTAVQPLSLPGWQREEKYKGDIIWYRDATTKDAFRVPVISSADIERCWHFTHALSHKQHLRKHSYEVSVARCRPMKSPELWTLHLEQRTVCSNKVIGAPISQIFLTQQVNMVENQDTLC